jgi:hypothetical protein
MQMNTANIYQAISKVQNERPKFTYKTDLIMDICLMKCRALLASKNIIAYNF